MKSQYCKLSRNEIDFIKDEVKRCEITFSHLEEELLDHLCCMVEEMMSEGHTFESALALMKKDVGIETLKSIEVEIIILINEKIKAMRKTLKISGIIGLSAIVFSSILKFLHWPGASYLLIVGFAALLFTYLPVLSLTIKKEKILKRKLHLTYIGIFAASVLLISLLVTLLHLPYGTYFMVLSWFLMLIFLVMLFNVVMKTEEDRVLNLSMLLFFSILFVINIALNLQDVNNPRLNRYTIEPNLEVSTNLYVHKVEKCYKQLSLVISNDSATKLEVRLIKEKIRVFTDQIETVKLLLFASKAKQEEYSLQFFKDNLVHGTVQSWKLGVEVKELHDFLLEKSISQPQLHSFINNNIQFGYSDSQNDKQVLYNNLQRLLRDIKIAEYELLNEMQMAIKVQ